jgi:hypothetical protein
MAKFMYTHTAPPGKLSSPRFVVPALVAIMVLVAASSLRAGQMDNPEYIAWAKFKVESSRTLAVSGGGGGYVRSSGGVAYISQTLRGIADDAVRISLGKNTNTFRVPAKIDDKSLKHVGEESIQAMGKTFKCSVYEVPKYTSPNGEKTIQTKKWICGDVPGGLVKQEDAHTGPGPSAGQQYKWTETSLLSAYEVK